jgi:DNA-directed RNA polymerase specialized sigma24 family protein
MKLNLDHSSESPRGSHPSATEVFEVLMRQNAGHLMAFIRALVRNESLAEDVFDRERPFGPWLRGIAHLTALAMFRKGKREIYVDSAVVEALEVRAEALERSWMGMEHNPLETLQDCVGRLPERYRDAVEILYRGDRSVADVAAATEMGLEAAKKRLQRARHLLADCLRTKGVLS